MKLQGRLKFGSADWSELATQGTTLALHRKKANPNDFSRRSFIKKNMAASGFIFAAGSVLQSLSTYIHAQDAPINVCIQFAGSLVPAADRPAVIAAAQNLFAGTGVNFFDQPPAGGCTLFVNFGALDGDLGIAYKERQQCVVSINNINNRVPAGPRRARAYAEILAHEVGHLLCATHQCLGDGRKQDNDRACPMAPTLMSFGSCIRPGNLGQMPGVLTFNDLAQRQIRNGITRLRQRRPNWGLRGRFRPGTLCLVEGRTYYDPIIFDGEQLAKYDSVVSFTYSLSGRQDLFEFGWLNEDDEFVEPLPAEDNPEQILEAEDGTVLNFAVRGRAGTPLEGLVFQQADFATLTFSGQQNPASSAANPDVGTDYFSQVTVNFYVEGNLLSVFLDASFSGVQNGFYRPTDVDSTPPSCTLVGSGVTETGEQFITVDLQDIRSGLRAVAVLDVENATVSIPDFRAGTSTPVEVTVTTLDQSQVTRVELQGVDMAGNVAIWEPLMLQIGRDTGRPVSHTITGTPQAERTIRLYNRTPGLTNLRITVNGQQFELAGLRDNEVRTVNVSSAMLAGTDNTITLEARGRPGGSAAILISE